MVEWLAGNRIIGTTAERPNLGLPSGSVGGWVELARNKIGTALSDFDVGSLDDKKYYMVLTNITGKNNSGVNWQTRMGSGSIDTNPVYSFRYSLNGGGDSYSSGQSSIQSGTNPTNLPQFSVAYIANISGQEKLYISHDVNQQTAGAGTAPQRGEYVGKWVYTSNPLNVIGATTGSGSYTMSADSEMVVLGWDPTDTHTTNFWEELANVDYQGGGALLASTPTFASKKYLWVQAYVKQASGYASGMTFNGDTTRGSTNYAFRYSANGGADATPHLNTWATIKNYSSLAGGGYFFNAFIINNASNEKLVIGTTSENPATGAATSPNTMQTSAKWNDATNPITKVNIIGENGSGNISNGTQIRVWGSN